jgi:hypothetical protein
VLVLGLEGQSVAQNRVDETVDLVRLERDVPVHERAVLSKRLEVELAVDLEGRLDRHLADVDTGDVSAIDSKVQVLACDGPLGMKRALPRQ